MTLHINVPLSESTYRRVKQWAESRRQDVGEAIAEYLDDTLPTADNVAASLSEEDAAVAREEAAYIRLHPQLKETHFGKYVAIYGGELVDYDIDNRALYKRIDERYPDEFVWMSRVEDEAIGTIYFRSPRFVDGPEL
jgi:broad specificity phosphatase PhoE